MARKKPNKRKKSNSVPKDFSIPSAFCENSRNWFSSVDEHEAFLSAIETPNPWRSIRLNDTKANGAIADFDQTIDWCTNARKSTQHIPFIYNPSWHIGEFYVQESSSMFIEALLDVTSIGDEKKVVLDLCASPGGKSTHLASLLKGNGVLVANEVNRSRVKVLRENLMRWGNANVMVTNNDPADFEKLTATFDIIAIDAPCSGEGMFRKDHGARAEWSIANVEICAARQKRIVRQSWAALKPGGYMLYSTCTFNRDENEGILEYLQEEFMAEPIALQSQFDDVAFSSTHAIYRFYPHKTTGEGFSVFLVKKPENDDVDSFYQSQSVLEEVKDQKMIADLKLFFNNSDELLFKLYKEKVLAIQKDTFELFNNMGSALHIAQLGIPVGEHKADEWHLEHAFALAADINTDAFECLELDYQQAIQFLQCESFKVEDCPLGKLLVTYKGLPLGWVKNIGSRLNNKLPTAYSIKKRLNQQQLKEMALMV